MIVETYGVETELMDGAAVRVIEPGEVYARDEFVYWGSSAESLVRLARHAGFAGFELVRFPDDRRAPALDRHHDRPRVTAVTLR